MSEEKTELQKQKDLPFKRAKETCDNPYFLEEPVYKVTSLGLPERQVLVDLESNDMAAFWAAHEKALWLVVVLFSLFFLSRIISVGF